MTAVYAFTDYRVQGQAITCILVDIATPPTGGLNLFNLYVALSRSSIFQATHSPELLAEDDRLDGLDLHTRQWWQEISATHTVYDNMH
ncbi:hypothetical protein M404DRAFT_163469 [Pisolithus tinctorius Marx 270]|uniref:Uncharacterized protein n=1 Tax=Pisolithus tinctorius Marx 270 TaxID=870435 RepID=A0A0C3JFH8_PISTI|nr:hypothetical protein M404DRAFT_163469 [Pisolithus tinctorius Marx 270]